MALPAGFQKARLEIENGQPIECAFNPESYTVSKSNVWTFKPTTGVDLPKAEFGGGLPRHTRLSLLLDVSLAGGGASVKDQANALLTANPRLDIRPGLSGNNDVVWVCGRGSVAGITTAPTQADGTSVVNKYLPASCRA